MRIERINKMDSQVILKQDVRVACILGWGWNQADSLRLAGEG